MTAIRTWLGSLLHECAHDGPLTPVRTLPGAEIWRCPLCGADVLYPDEPFPPFPSAATVRAASSRDTASG